MINIKKYGPNEDKIYCPVLLVIDCLLQISLLKEGMTVPSFLRANFFQEIV